MTLLDTARAERASFTEIIQLWLDKTVESFAWEKKIFVKEYDNKSDALTLYTVAKDPKTRRTRKREERVILLPHSDGAALLEHLKKLPLPEFYKQVILWLKIEYPFIKEVKLTVLPQPIEATRSS